MPHACTSHLQAASAVGLPTAVTAMVQPRPSLEGRTAAARVETCTNPLDEQVVQIIHHHIASLAFALLGALHLLNTLLCHPNIQQRQTNLRFLSEACQAVACRQKDAWCPLSTAHYVSKAASAVRRWRGYYRWLVTPCTVGHCAADMYRPCSP